MEPQELSREQLKATIESLQLEIERLKAIDTMAEEDLRKEAERNTILLQFYDEALQLRDKELYDYTLDQVVHLTDSTIGFVHIVSDDQQDVILTTWNNEALKNCTALYDTHYAVELAGNWVDCVRLKRPIIYNEFSDSPNQKGLPEGHVAIRRFMSIPVLEEDKVRIIFGVGNKTEPYGDRDVVQLQLVANELHKIIKQRNLQRDKDKAEAARQNAYDELELKVQKRTLQLKERTEQLQAKITEQQLAEATLLSHAASQNLLLEIASDFNKSVAEEIDDIIITALRMIGEFDHADRSYVGMFSDDQSAISATHEWCAEGISAAMDKTQDMSAGVMPWWTQNLGSLEFIHIPRVADLPPEALAEKEIMQAQSVQSFIAVPMFLEEKALGFLGFSSVRRERTWSEDSIIMLKSVAQIISKALMRKKFADDLQASENYYRTIFENTGAATMIIEEDMSVANINDECQRLLGYAKEELIGAKWTDFIPGDKVETMQEYHRMRRLNLVAVPLKYQTQIIDREGKNSDGLLALDIIPGTSKSVVTFIDFTEFNRIDRALKATSAVNRAMIQAENEEGLLRDVCQKILEVGGYSLVGVVYLGADQQTLQPVAHAGNDNGYLAKLNISLQDPKRGQGPTGTAIRTGQPVVARDFEKNGTFEPWLKDALQQGFKSSMSIPLMADNRVFGALIIYSHEIGRFDNNEQILVNEMANDLGYAIMFLRNRSDKNQTAEELKVSLEKMRRILLQAVTSLGATLDTRDPYTAGHQRRVARLAAAIAEEMNLSKEQIDGIVVTGSLHDIGKTNVPSEILSKPGKLSEIEFALIKTHPEAGYEIVKDIEFPWPVAEVLLQHHERLNGSGYPRGLTGEDTLVEARIIAVADVVEAMASHRPYRPALGIETALEEIVQNRGVLYDSDVVDACLNLFRERGFKLDG